MGFWSKLKKQASERAPSEPIMVLAPMADVTDEAFRRVIAKYGKPDAIWTEFVSADGLCHPEGRKKLLVDLSYSETERPIVAQLFSGRPEKMFEAAKLVKELGFDGLDINMGCPDRSIEKSGAGASLMKKPQLAREIIRAAKEGAGDLPVSVKTRIGYNKNELAAWLPELLAEEPAVITVHARTRKEMSEVPARWEEVKRAVEIRDNLKSKTLIFGNGDVTDLNDARVKAKLSGADGVMLGRAIFGNPFLFSALGKQKSSARGGGDNKSARLLSMSDTTDSIADLASEFILRTSRFSTLEDSLLSSTGKLPFPRPLSLIPHSSPRQTLGDERGLIRSVETRLRVMLEHTKLFDQLFHGIKNFAVMKKHYKAYVNGWDGAKELRVKLMEAETVEEIEIIVKQYLATV